MTGMLNAAIAGVAASNVAVTVGSGSGNHGYEGTIPIGSRTPTSVLGQTITVIASTDTSRDLTFRLGGTLSQSLFRYLLVRDGTGAFRKYNSADATFSTGAGQSGWSWGDGSNKVWNSTDAGEVHTVQIFR